MECLPKFIAQSLSDIPSGMCCGFIHGDSLRIGIAVRDPELRETAMVVLMPGVDVEHQADLLRRLSYNEKPALVFDRSRVRIDFARAGQIGKEAGAIVGALAVVDGKPAIVARVHQDLACAFDIASGETLAYLPGKHPYYTSWAIEVADGVDRWERLVSFDIRVAS